MRKLLILLSLIAVGYGNEWFTSRLQHCIERCTLREKLGRSAYACYTTDGEHKEFRSSNRTISNSGRPTYDHPIPSLDDDMFPWDFCTPSKVDKLDPVEDEDVDNDNENNLYPDNNNDDQGGFNGGSSREGSGSGGSGWNPGSKADESVLEDGVCSSSCRKDGNNVYKCNYEGSQEQFYCSPNTPLERKQITSVNKLWCISNCDPDSLGGTHTCRTMMGRDFCSKDKGFSVKGTRCQGPCAVWEESFHNYLSCKVDEGLYEQCGNWDVEEYEIKVLEFTHEDKVCAGPCQEHDGSKHCPFVEWREEGSEEDPKAVMYMMEGKCGPNDEPNWTLVGIILGSAVASIILIGIIGVFVSRKSGYNRAATQGI